MSQHDTTRLSKIGKKSTKIHDTARHDTQVERHGTTRYGTFDTSRTMVRVAHLRYPYVPFNETYAAYMERVKYTSEKVEAAMKTVMLNRASGGETMVAGNEPEVNTDTHLSQIKILDPNVSQTNGRKKDAKGKENVQASDRIKSSIELSTQKKKRLCSCCKKMKRHDKRNSPEILKKFESESSEGMHLNFWLNKRLFVTCQSAHPMFFFFPNTDDDDKFQLDEDAESCDD
ncbi:hypothetical protein Dimus_001041 [Dionaea muscipula]